jgi:hypothetical protein
MRFWQRLIDILRRRETGKPLPTRVAIDGDCVSVYAGDDVIESFRWHDLDSVRAWKQDCFGMDRIWLGFDLRGNDEPVCVHEEMAGYTELVEEIQRQCKGYREDWWYAVAFPAFAENHTLVWEQPGS